MNLRSFRSITLATLLWTVIALLAAGCSRSNIDPTPQGTGAGGQTSCACGDGTCDALNCGENSSWCPQDCAGQCTCGDGFCDFKCGESSNNCPQDCGQSCFCGDGVCQPACGETNQNYPQNYTKPYFY